MCASECYHQYHRYQATPKLTNQKTQQTASTRVNSSQVDDKKKENEVKKE